MSLNRFEAFSDGVFAIAMTLLVIEIKLPDLSHTAPAAVIGEMWHIAPHLLSYMTSFLVIGVVWLNHHALFHLSVSPCQPLSVSPCQPPPPTVGYAQSQTPIDQ